MKDKIQIALLSVIAVALVAIAVNQFTSGESKSGPVASRPVAAASSAEMKTANSFDPMANNAQPVDNTPKTTIVFDKYDHDFGNIKQDTENRHTFSFTNTGNHPLIIESATGSCGCTVPNYPKEPIPPGGVGTIDVEYKPGRQENQQTKTVTVVANTEPKETTLRVTANVQKVD
jgi:hypothetical protein